MEVVITARLLLFLKLFMLAYNSHAIFAKIHTSSHTTSCGIPQIVS